MTRSISYDHLGTEQITASKCRDHAMLSSRNGSSHGRERTSEPWRVGVLFSRTGFMSVIEETQLRGTLIAIEEINDAGGINGRPVIPSIYDPGSDVRSYGQYAKRLMVDDGVSTIFGCY
ncbi:transporter substrate-binding protein [Ancylobacter sp. IITR112]|uniref:transporter substrate-binding protein n=1 Tax=Ancylobacter sp. IITR112 TaxID=3138073 RepID=UPI00352A49AE